MQVFVTPVLEKISVCKDYLIGSLPEAVSTIGTRSSINAGHAHNLDNVTELIRSLTKLYVT